MINSEDVKLGVSGRYKLTVTQGDGNKIILETPWFDNLITDHGLDRIFLGGFAGSCQVGTGITSPAVTDTALVSSVASTSTAGSYGQTHGGTGVVGDPYWKSSYLTFSFPVGAVVGNISEVGIFQGTTACSRALIMDEQTPPQPTSISLGATDQLHVTYALRVYFPVTPTTGQVQIDGVPYDWTCGPYKVDAVWGTEVNGKSHLFTNGITATTGVTLDTRVSSAGPFAPTAVATSVLTPNPSTSPPYGPETYTPGTFTRNYKTFASRTAANGSWKTLYFNLSGPGFQFELDPPYVKDNTVEFGITFSLSLSRYSP